METCCDIDVLPIRSVGAALGLSRVTLESGVGLWVGADDASLPFADEIDDYAVSQFSEAFLAVLQSDGARRLVSNYRRGILTGYEFDVRLLDMLRA